MFTQFLLWILGSGAVLARASGNNPIVSTATVWVFYLAFNLLEAMVETLIWGERFEHWLDPLFILCFLLYATIGVWWCAELREKQNQ